MLRAFTLCLALLTSQLLLAQITVTTDIIPLVGDTLYTTRAQDGQTVDLISTGGPHNWDFSAVVAGGDQVRLVEESDPNNPDDAQFPNADAKVSFGEGTYNYYRISNNQLDLIGNIGSVALLPDFVVATPFSPAYVDRRAPMDFIDQFDNTANLVVAFPTDSLPQQLLDLGGTLLAATDSVRLRTTIDQNDLVDAYGSMTVDGATYEVLREKRTEIREIRVDTYVGILGWQDVTSAFLALVGDLPGGGDFLAGQDTTITYNFWSATDIVPIASVVTDTEGNVESINYKTNRDGTSPVIDNSLRSATIRVYPNPSVDWITFEALDVPRADYSLHIHNGLGQRMISERFLNTDQIRFKIDLSHLPSGLYYYSLRNSRGRAIATKRLLIGGYQP
ncbi:MAG: T9SS type A sorting domain-containing protein [Bacteroidota bacterium]